MNRLATTLLFHCPKWNPRSIIPPCAARIQHAAMGTTPGADVADYSYCLTCPDSAVAQDKSEPKQNKKGRISRGRYDRKPEKHQCDRCKVVKDFTEENFAKTSANKFSLSYTCKECSSEIRRKNKASEWQRR